MTLLLLPRTFHFIRQYSTIYALSSGYGKCGVAIVRVSGPQASASLLKLARLKKLPQPRRALFKSIYENDEISDKIDEGLILWFPAPFSFTGEDVVEYQIHGGVAVVRSLLSALGRFDAHRAASAGEFTRRAFQNGKMDLTRVEGLGDLIHAETEHQRRQALRQMDGQLFRLYDGWRNELIRLVAHIEASIDFSESEELDDDSIKENLTTDVQRLIQNIQDHLNDFRAGERLRNGVKITIAGRPNAGKSTLLNYLSQKQAAIVSDIAGTTRDVIECKIDIGGYPVILTDTAGLRKKEAVNDTIEIEGIKRAFDEIQNSDLVIHLKDANDILSSPDNLITNCDVLSIVNKIDLKADIECGISLKTGQGVEKFMNELKAKVEELCLTKSGECSSFNRTRYKTHLENTLYNLNEFVKLEDFLESECDIAAHSLRKAIREIGYITGQVDPEKIFDVIFADFCIGK